MRWIGIIIAITLAAAAAFMVIKFSGGGDEPPHQQITQVAPVVQTPVSADIETVNVYVAANFIPVGTGIEEGMLDTQPWPKHLVIEGFITNPEECEKLKGMVTRSSFQPREPIIRSKVVNANDPNFLAGALEKGKRITTVAVDAVSGIAGFVFPGDRVDVLVIHKVDKPGLTPLEMELLDDEEKKELIIETILTNIKVVAADQRSSVNNEEGILVPSSVSLEVTPEDAQRLKLAADVGTISLALRSIKDKDTVESVALLRATELSQLSASAPQTPRKVGNVSLPVTVIRGTQVDDVESKKKKEEEFQQQSAVIQ